MSDINKEEEQKVVDHWSDKFKRSMIHKSKETLEWKKYWSAYTGEMFLGSDKPSYKSDQISNFIFSTIETIRPIMVDGDPAFLAMAKNTEGIDKQALVQTALDYEFNRENMSEKIQRQTITCLVLGTCIWFIGWDGHADSDYEGEIKAIEVNPFNLYPDPMATSIEDAEHLIYAKYEHVNQLRKKFPSKAERIIGDTVKFEELVGNQEAPSDVSNQVLVLEIWCRDYSETEEMESVVDGKVVKLKKRKYPNGRVLTIAPDLGIVLSDKENPYQDGKFPFVMIKDYDVPFKFWGEGEVKQLLSPQSYINDLSNQVIDNARLSANMPWILDKNSGIGYGKLTNQPGLIIRKNPGSEVRRDTPPAMPNYVMDKIHDLKADIESISGVHDVTQGKRPTGIQAGNAIVALQEAGQARIRMKVKLMEKGLSKISSMWYKRMQQFWKLNRWIRMADDNESGNYIFASISSDDLQADFDIDITAGSTMQKNRAGMLDLLIRLGQTQAEDGLPVVDRDTILDYVDVKNKDRILKKFNERAEQQNINEETSETVGMFGEQLNSSTQDISSILEEMNNMIAELNQEIGELKVINDEKKKEEEQEKLQRNMNDEAVKVAQDYISEANSNQGETEEETPNIEEIAMLYINGEIEDEELLSLLEQLGIDQEEFISVVQAIMGNNDTESMEPGFEDVFDDEMLQMIDSLSEEELQELLQAKPEIAEIIGNNLPE